jgi:putative transposase
MNICEWYNRETILIQNYIATPNEFYDTKVPNKYKNVLSSLKKSDNIFKLNFLDDYKVKENNDIICSHKYQINFSKKQHEILIKYFKECNMIYNLCVDIWKEYSNVTTNWQLLKDVIFNHIYRTKNDNFNILNAKNLIINELKKKQEDYNITNQKNQEKIKELKLLAKEKFKKEMEEYQIKIKENKKTIIKEIIKRPIMDKIKITKIVKPCKERGETIKKPAPDETLKAEIRDFCKNLSNAKDKSYQNSKYNKETKKRENAIYEMKYKNTKLSQTISVSDRNITKDGLVVRALGNLECENFKKITQKYPLDKECKLQYDFTLNKYYLYVIFDGDEKIIKNRKEIVAIDQGEKIFNYFYSNNTMGKLGDNMRVKILEWQKDIKKYQSIIDNKKNKEGNKINNLKKLKMKVRKLYLKIKGYVNEIHKKSAKYLCENYSHIILPEFKTKPMISKYEINTETNRIKKLNKEEGKKEIHKLNKRIRLSNNVKFVLSMQSHYKFKEYLKATAKRYRTVIYDVDESYTSQSCTMCGILSKDYDNKRLKTCTGCKYKVDRDVNGSRNIYIKSICSMPGMKARLASLKCHKNVEECYTFLYKSKQNYTL